MITEGIMVYFNKEEKPAADIKTLVDLAKRKELLVMETKRMEDAGEKGIDHEQGCGPKIC